MSYDPNFPSDEAAGFEEVPKKLPAPLPRDAENTGWIPAINPDSEEFFSGDRSYGSQIQKFDSESRGSFGPVGAQEAQVPPASPNMTTQPFDQGFQGQTNYQGVQAQRHIANTAERQGHVQQARQQFDHVESPIEDRGEVVGVTRSIVEWAIVIVGAIFLAFVIRTFLLQAFWIPSPSMTETLAVGDRILVNKVNYRVSDINRLDVVVFKNPDVNDENKELVKRVIGLPGETIELRAGEVFINGISIGEEAYIADSVVNDSSFELTTIPDDSYFVLGDNRSNSSDSRSSLGSIERDLVVGKAFVKFWPPSRIGRIQ